MPAAETDREQLNVVLQQRHHTLRRTAIGNVLHVETARLLHALKQQMIDGAGRGQSRN